MRKLFLTLIILFAGSCIAVAQNTTTQNPGAAKNNAPKMIQPDMQKDTVPLFQGHFAGPVKASDFKSEDSLVINKVGFQVVGFTLVYSKEKDTVATKLESKFNKLTPEMIAALKALQPGQNFSFVNIRIMVKGGTPIRPTYDRIDMFIEREKQ